MTRNPESAVGDERSHAEHSHIEQGAAEDPIPAPEHRPPYSEDFLAHLHGGMYEDLPEHAQLWRGILADPDAAGVIGALDKVVAQLHGLRAWAVAGHETDRRPAAPPPKASVGRRIE